MLPLETIEAVFPSSAKVGEVRLEPMTGFHATAMEALGVEVAERNVNSDARSVIGAWLLSLPKEKLREALRGDSVSKMTRWMKRHAIDPREARAALDASMRAAFSTFVPPKKDETKHAGATGYGWPLEVAEFLAHEYSTSIDAALSLPLSTAFALLSVARQRNGGESGGPDYYGRIEMRELSAMFKAKREAQNKEGNDGREQN